MMRAISWQATAIDNLRQYLRVDTEPIYRDYIRQIAEKRETNHQVIGRTAILKDL